MAEEDRALFFRGLCATATSDSVRAIGVQGKRWVTLDLATQEWRWMFYREKYAEYGPIISQVSLF